MNKPTSENPLSLEGRPLHFPLSLRERVGVRVKPKISTQQQISAADDGQKLTTG